MLLYADEDFAWPVIVALRGLGHDAITAQEDGMTARPDAQILARAHTLGRAVLTYNRRHFDRLHRRGDPHSGIVFCTHDDNFAALAGRIHHVLAGLSTGRWCLRINRPQ